MGKRKNKDWYDNKIGSIKRRKRALTKSVADGEFGLDDGYKRNSEIKKIKDDLKREKRAAKRAEKQNWKEEVEEILNKDEDELGLEE
jgi:hypothetical protein